MQKNAFSSLSVIHLPAPSRLLASACCPDKDLVALVTRLGTQERLSLWKLSGSRTWEVDLSAGPEDYAVDVAWSPDGRSLAVAHKGVRITVHSIQDGHAEKSISVLVQQGSQCYSSIWWFKQELPTTASSAPDVFKRDNILPGTSRSIIQSLPMLDYLAEETRRSTATDLFAFQGSQTRPAQQSTASPVMEEWPALNANLIAASIDVPGQPHDPQKILDDRDDANENSILMAITDSGVLHSYYEGIYPVGWVPTTYPLNPLSVHKDPKRPAFYAHSHVTSGNDASTSIFPIIIQLPLMAGRRIRDMASLSTLCKDLCAYVMRVVKEMRTSWFGSDISVAAKELGPKWIRDLETKLKEHVGSKDNNPILDLTSLLLTGRASQALADFMGSGEQMSERGLQKWESTMTEVLVKLREFPEKRIAPACQRIHLVLEEIQGWSHIPEYSAFNLHSQDIQQCLDNVNRTIVLAAWLASTARREYLRFKEFMTWVKYEVELAAAVSAGNDTSTVHMQHDILEVNKYFESGLVVSPIDKWFIGNTPKFQPSDLRASGSDSLQDALQRARDVLDNPEQMAWDHRVNQKDLSHIDRNIVKLVEELVQQCQTVFAKAAGATGRSATFRGPLDLLVKEAIPHNLITRERTVFDANNGDGEHTQYLALASLTSQDPNILCLTRIKYGPKTLTSVSIEVCLLECNIPNEDGETQELELLEVEFFDDECVVIVYRLREDKGAFIATVGYHDLGYQELVLDAAAQTRGRENLMQEALLRLGNGQLASVQIPIKRCRRLVGCESGRAMLAVNGRAGRRVACVLDGKGMSVESLDMEGDDGDENADLSMMSED